MAIKGYWRLNGNSNDASGNGYNGTGYSVTYPQSAGKLNSSVSLAGNSSSYCDIPFVNTNYITVSFWMKCNSSTNYYPLVVHKDGLARSGTRGWAFFLYDSIIYCALFNATAEFDVEYGIPTITAWNHVCVTYNGAAAILYINGINKHQISMTGNLRSNTDTLRIGRRASDASYFNGSIDELIIDNTGWSVAMVKNEYARAKGFF